LIFTNKFYFTAPKRFKLKKEKNIPKSKKISTKDNFKFLMFTDSLIYYSFKKKLFS